MRLCENLQSFKTFFTLEQFHHAWILVNSRNFRLLIDNQETECMVPLADMINHREPDHTVWYFDQKKQGFILKAVKPIQGGDEITSSYCTTYNTHEILFGYGFIDESNPQKKDIVCVEVDIDMDDLLYDKKDHWLSSYHFP
jgi:protein-histidine N-methyltransferase